MEKIVIIGAGAIGRGFLPWIFAEHYELIYVDSNEKIVSLMNRQGSFTSYCIQKSKLLCKKFSVKKAYRPSDFLLKEYPDAKAIFINVGPRNCAEAARSVRGTQLPIIVSENDPQTIARVQQAALSRRVYYSVPDVITSNTAPPHLLKKDPLSVVTEDGVMFVDERLNELKGNFERCNAQELNKQWIAKLYLHNTPHCVAAYLGALANLNLIYETMKIPTLREIVSGTMKEMLQTLRFSFNLPDDFLEWYAQKELDRFTCNLLYDPISRVAREPLRKLEYEGRLIGAAQLCLSVGIVPTNILVGIVSAVMFGDQKDPDRHISMLFEELPKSIFLTHVLKLRKGEALYTALDRKWESLIRKLHEIQRPIDHKKDSGTVNELGL